MIESGIIDDNASMNIEEEHYEQLFDGRLCPSQKDAEGKKRHEYIFHTMWELFVYAAVLGIKFDRSKTIKKPYKPFRWGNISPYHQKNLLLLTTSKNNNLEFLKDGNAVKKSIEDYANGGLNIILQEIKNNSSAYSGVEDITYRIMEDIEKL